MSPLDATKASFVMFHCFDLVAPGNAITIYGEGHNISVTRLRYSAKHNALNSCPIRAHLTSQNDELCENRHVSERRGIEEHQ